MALFKYFRCGIYMDKALRYNELYFSANHELNDPNDLVSYYIFEDDESLWIKLFNLSKKTDVFKSININGFGENFIKDINSFFKDRKFFSDWSGLNNFFEKIDNKLDRFLTPYISDLPYEDVIEENPNNLSQKKILFKFMLKELLARGINLKFFSISFSADALNPIMWAHYADGFKGCVIIYEAKNNFIDISESLYSNEFFKIEILNVTYEDNNKNIPILTCAVGGNKSKSIQEKLAMKNSFWKYENEKRALICIEREPILLCTKDKVNDSPRELIFHHRPNEIIGIIFGPNLKEEIQRKIEYSLRHNKYHSKAGNFHCFRTELKSSGDIIIKSGTECIVKNSSDNSLSQASRILNAVELEKLTKELEIVKD
ncbi:DUF2971 domain-containing protein [Thorsellia kenyensis]|uniref:DUF2971 domain-containing protein n=1 Tax=Thorsellia kenyensis TaxID=1549888 RepID=A0ABV6CFU9_9GAMM